MKTERKTSERQGRIWRLGALVCQLTRPFSDPEAIGIEMEELRFLTRAIRIIADDLYKEKGHGPHEEARLCDLLLRAYSVLTVPPEDEMIRKRRLIVRACRALDLLPKRALCRRSLLNTFHLLEL